MAKPKPDPDMVAYAIAQVAAGKTRQAIAAELKELGYNYSPSAIGKWLVAANAPPAQPVRKAPDGLLEALKARNEAKPATPPPPVNVTDTIGTLRTIVEGMLAEAHDAKLSNPKLSATLAKAAGDLMNTILRGEKTKAEDANMLRIDRKGIADTRQLVLERVAVATQRPLLCAECGRALSIEWGEAAHKVAEALKGSGT